MPNVAALRGLGRTAAIAISLVAAVLLIVPFIAQAAPAAGWRVIGATGPTNLPPQQSEVQRLRVIGEGGTYTLSAQTAGGEGRLSFAGGFVSFSSGSDEAVIIATLQGSFAEGQEITGPEVAAGTKIEAVNGNTIVLTAPATGTGAAIVSAVSPEITGVSTSFGAFRAGASISGAGIPAGTIVVSAAGDTLTISQNPTSGGVVALSGPTETTAPIAFDAPATGSGSVAEAIDALPGFGAGSVAVVGGPGDPVGERPYSVTFEGHFLDQDVPLLSADASGLTGASATVLVGTLRPGGPGTGELAIYATNVGAASTSAEATTVKAGPFPAGIAPSVETGRNGEGWRCTIGGIGLTTAICQSQRAVESGKTERPVILPLTVGVGAPANSSVPISVEGGGAAVSDRSVVPLVVSGEPAKPGLAAFWAGAFEADGSPSARAGAHPNLAGTGFLLKSKLSANGAVVSAGDVRDVSVDLPPGFIGNPLASGSRCPQDQLIPQRGTLCGEGARVGYVGPVLNGFGEGTQELSEKTGVYADIPPFGYPAEFGFEILGATVPALASVRTDSDYGVTLEAEDLPQVKQTFGSFLTLYDTSAATGGKALLTNPADCSVQAAEAVAGIGPKTTITNNSWQDQNPDAVDNELEDPLPPVTGCDQLGPRFHPGFSMQPQSHEAASPSAFTAQLTIPQEGLTDPEALVAPELKKTVVTLPRGLDVNPSSANGLEACSETQMGLVTTDGAAPNPIRFDKSEPSCPDASKLGTVEARSPLLEETLEGTIYLAAQEENPFHSLLALYLVIDSPKNGILVKLTGEATPDPSTGQLTVTFDNNPQLPVEDLKLNFRGGGPRSPLATPAVCGTYTTRGELTPWSAPESGPPAQTEDSFQVSSGPAGGGCATSEGALPFSPSLEAGTTSTQAGAYAPLVVKLARKDGEQELTHLEFSLPPGLTGKLVGIPYCPDAAIAEAAGKAGKAEQASPSCPAASELGTVDTAAGVGSEPIHVGGHVYLAGPYKGAPLSAVVITPAVAGPFDLGDVVVRAALQVDPETAQITAKSDEIPHILKGIPLQLRSVEIKVTRDGFTLNPTSCNPMSVGSSLGGLNGGSATPSSRFQVGACNALKFKPRLQLSLKGSTARTGHPALKAVVTYPQQGAYANIARAQVNLPHSEFLDQANLNKTCTKPVLLAGNCPKSTIYGKATAWTPLLEKPLEGPVYLVGGYGYKLPALVAELNGQIRIVLKGKVDSGPNHGIRNTFEAVPDAPVSRFVLEMKGGKKYSLLENSEPLCRKPQRAIARFTAQNGKVLQTKPLVRNSCKSVHKKNHRHHHPAKKGGAAHA